jgi:hypothetical protein
MTAGVIKTCSPEKFSYSSSMATRFASLASGEFRKSARLDGEEKEPDRCSSEGIGNHKFGTSYLAT